jgi:hypothetical protein
MKFSFRYWQITVAYIVLGFQTVSNAVGAQKIVLLLTATVIATIATIDPFFWEKTLYSFSSQTPEQEIPLLLTANRFQDPLFAHQQFLERESYLSITEKSELHHAAYARAYQTSLTHFWKDLLALTPNHTTALKALSALELSGGNTATAQSYLKEYLLVEPNDPDREILESAIQK